MKVEYKTKNVSVGNGEIREYPPEGELSRSEAHLNESILVKSLRKLTGIVELDLGIVGSLEGKTREQYKLVQGNINSYGKLIAGLLPEGSEVRIEVIIPEK